ncbi:MAG: hypothetical protein HY544_00835 [Candidatus Diapherotrites archaeon]|uniref:Uncharacterized protein n=1 Tax=Candidatus Iainarchaeum sp. TaxID=3101447 RepID=A0A8T3YLU3_9ARCH|nr:hypothetical protein [Candidatus Diapherotrites archaeon]
MKFHTISDLDENKLGSGPIRFYVNAVLDNIAKNLDTKDSDVILDFGCNHQFLKQKINPRAKYVGYDIYQEYSDIADINQITPTVVVASHVLEHLTIEELDSFLDYCVKKKIRLLAVALPLENILSKILRWATRIKFSNEILHKLDYLTVMKNINERFENVGVSTVFFMSVNSVWAPRMEKKTLKKTEVEKAEQRVKSP